MAWDDQIDIGDAPQAQPTVSLGPTTPQVDPDTANLRAQKATFGLSDYLPYSKDDWYTSIISGQENTARKAASAAVNYNDIQTRLKTLQTDGHLPPPNLSEPDSVIEKEYANKFAQPFTNMGNDFYKGSYYGTVNVDNPSLASQAADIASKIGTRYELAKKIFNSPQTIGQAAIGGFVHGMGEAGPIGSWIDPKWGLLPLPRAELAAIGYPIELGAHVFHGLAEAAKQGSQAAYSAFGGGDANAESFSNEVAALVEAEFAGLTGRSPIGEPVAKTAQNVAETVQQAAKADTRTRADKLRDFINDPSITPAERETAQGRLDIIEGRAPKPPIEKAVEDTVKAMATADGTRPIEAVQASVHGDTKTAAVEQTAHDINIDGTATAERQRDLNSLTSNFRIDMDQIQKDPGFGGQDLVNRIRDANDGLVANLEQKIQTVMKVNRTPYTLAQRQVIQAEMDRIQGTYRGLGNAIIDMDGPIYDGLTNTYHTSVKIGDFDGQYFKTETQAKLFAELHGIHIAQPANPLVISPGMGHNQGPALNSTEVGANVVKNQGSGWYIQVKKPFDENSKAVFGSVETGLGTHPDTRSPHSWFNSFFKGYLSSPPMTMSKTEMINRRVTAHTPSEIKELANPDWKIINSIHRDSWAKFNRLLEAGRDLYDKEGNKGYFFESPGEIEEWHALMYPDEIRPPTDVIEGYFAYKRLYNLDLALRNISAYRFAARLGTEMHQWSVRDADGKKIPSGYIMGIKRTSLPSGNDAVLILGKVKNDDDVMSARKLGTTTRGKQIKADIESGKAHVVEIYDPDRKELGNISTKGNQSRVRYVISYTAPETKPLDVGRMVNRRGGGHFEYKFNGAAVQPIIEYDKVTNTHNYMGDRIITMHESPGEGKDFAWRMNIVRKYIQDGELELAKTKARELLHMGDERFNSWFQPRRLPNGGRLDPYLSYEHPIVFVHRGESSIDYSDAMRQKYAKTFRDATTSGSAASQFKVQYTGERDAEQVFTAANKGTWHDPLWEYEPVKMLDPLPVLGRAINRIANSQAGDDMKIASVTHWLKEAYPYMSRRSQIEARAAPWRVFNSNELTWNDTTENLPIIRELEGNRRKIKNFSGAFNPQERFAYSMATKISESLYKKRTFIEGYDPSDPAGTSMRGVIKPDVAPTWLLPTLSDPWRIARSIAVHPILGMFKPSAFGMQMTTFGNVLGIAGPTRAASGFVGALMHEFTRANANPKFIDWLDRTATAFGWRRGEFKEAFNAMHTSGFFNVGSEHGYVDDPTGGYNPIKNVVRSAFDWGMKPFQEGAQFIRAASWYTAYNEFRHGGGGLYRWKGGSGVPTREEWGQILNRAGTLDHNMSRAATAEYQHGPGSIPTMFWSYKTRLTEFMLGFGGNRQLTTKEKVRLFATTALLFGPLYGPLGLFAVPTGDYVRKSMLSGNWNIPFTNQNMGHTTPYVTGSNFWLSAALEGMPAAGLAWYTGAISSNKSILDSLMHPEATAQRGNWYDIGPYFGNQSLAEDIVRDKTVLQMVMGAPGGYFANSWAHATPLAQSLSKWLIDGERGTSLNDIIQASRTINAVNAAYVGITAAGTHNWITRNNSVMQSDVTPMNAFFQAMTGLHDQQAIDAFDRRRIMSATEQARNTGEHLAKQEFWWYLEAKRNNDPEAAEAHRIRGMSYLAAVEYPKEKMDKFVQKALDEYGKSVVDDINKKFFRDARYPKGVSNEQLDKARENLERVQAARAPDGTVQPNTDNIDTSNPPPPVTKTPKPPRSHHKKKE